MLVLIITVVGLVALALGVFAGHALATAPVNDVLDGALDPVAGGPKKKPPEPDYHYGSWEMRYFCPSCDGSLYQFATVCSDCGYSRGFGKTAVGRVVRERWVRGERAHGRTYVHKDGSVCADSGSPSW